jgi:hypothetical protein
MGHRWKGVLNLKQRSSRGEIPEFRVLASLICNASNSLMLPESNAVFFVGDRVTDSDNPVVERLSQLENIAAAVLHKLGPAANLWIIEPSRYMGSFACYDNVLPSLTASGEPIGYKPKGLPAARACLSILQDCLEQVKAAQLHKKDEIDTAVDLQGKRTQHCDELVQKESPFQSFRDPVTAVPPTILLGFSKGGIILNQLIAEIVCCEESLDTLGDDRLRNLSTQDKVHEQQGSEEVMKNCLVGGQLLPPTVKAFLSSIEVIHFVDVGLNCQGAYQTDPRVLDGLAKAAKSREGGLYVGIHGTPRQWQDSRRRWVAMEKDRFVKLLNEAACKHADGKLQVSERLYFSDKAPNLQMHFEIIDHLSLR